MAITYSETCLWVDLTTGNIHREQVDAQLVRDFVGGYGLASRLLYDRIPAHVDPMGKENILGFVIGPLTGTEAPTGTRWTVVGKSPLTNTWGDANGSGYFGAAMRRAGYGAIFFSGISPQPVYLEVRDDAITLRDAADIWGLDCYETEDWVKENLGQDVEAACIGPSGEKGSLIAAVIHGKGRTAARSGLGALMGAKRLKMIAVSGTHEAPVVDRDRRSSLRTKYVKQMNQGSGFAELYRTTGTPGYTPIGIENGDSPTQNWRSSVLVFPDSGPLSYEELLKLRVRRSACWRCPIACWGTVRVSGREETGEAHQPEYETAAAFGSLIVNNDYPSIIRANDICNRYGLDTISAGTCVAFAIECFERGLISPKDTDGVELVWGDGRAMVRLLEQIAQRKAIGDLLADGVRAAAAELGGEASELAMHVAGQELPMHDTRFEPALAPIYLLDATPGRHTQAAQYLVPPGFESDRPAFGEGRENQTGRGRWVKEAACLCHTMNASGVCLFGYLSTQVQFVPEFLSAVTGWEFGLEDMLVVGERIANMRQAFNVRAGHNPLNHKLPSRAAGNPPLPDGPTAGIRVQTEAMTKEFLDDMEWTQDAAVPTKPVLERLGLSDVARDLWQRTKPASQGGVS